MKTEDSYKVVSIWEKIWNPLRGLNTYEIERLLNMAR